MPSSPGSISPTALGSYPAHENPLVIFPVVFLCTVFLLFSYSSILQRFHLPTFSRNRAPRRQLLNDANPDDPSLWPSVPQPRLGLLHLAQPADRSVLQEGSGDDEAKHLPNCAHKFHVACSDTWFRLHSNCPLCRAQVVCHLNVQSESVVSVRSLMETLDREDFVNERASSQSHYQRLRSQILENSATMRDALGNPTPENV